VVEEAGSAALLVLIQIFLPQVPLASPTAPVQCQEHDNDDMMHGSMEIGAF
jgi:hypothetical protein